MMFMLKVSDEMYYHGPGSPELSQTGGEVPGTFVQPGRVEVVGAVGVSLSLQAAV